MIGADGYDYITIKDLRINNSHGYGVSIGNSEHSTIENCYTYKSYRYGLGLARTKHCTISDNTVNDLYWNFDIGGDGIDINALSHAGKSQYNTVTRNIVINGNEGIGIYKKPEYTTVEYNVFTYNRTYTIYVMQPSIQRLDII